VKKPKEFILYGDERRYHRLPTKVGYTIIEHGLYDTQGSAF
jgi:hypothetical protein